MDKVKQGDRFGKLTVIKFHKREGYQSYWQCLCDCYGENMYPIVREDHLLSGHTKSCGCMKKFNQFKSKKV